MLKIYETDVKTVIWIQTSFLGDIILSTAAFNILASNSPGVKQYLVTTGIGQAVLKGHPALEGTIVFDKKNSSMVSAVRTVRDSLKHLCKKTTVILQAHKSARSSLLAMSLGFRRITYQESVLRMMSLTVPRVAALHESLRVALLLEPLGISRESFETSAMSLGAGALKPQLHEALNRLGSTIIAVAPGSVWGTKRWPALYYAKLVELLLKQGYGVVLLGAESEKEQIDPAVNKLGNHEHFLNLVGQTSLDDLKALYPYFSLLVSNDSSPIHFASAFGIPTVAIFGATVSSMGFGPLAAKSLVVERNLIDMPCRPCSDHGPSVCPLGHFKCMNDIKPLSVFEAVTSCLALS